MFGRELEWICGMEPKLAPLLGSPSHISQAVSPNQPPLCFPFGAPIDSGSSVFIGALGSFKLLFSFFSTLRESKLFVPPTHI